MSYNVNTVYIDASNYGFAIPGDAEGNGTLFELSSGELTLVQYYNTGLGLFEIDAASIISGSPTDDIFPSNVTTITDEYFEIDTDGNLTPKA